MHYSRIDQIWINPSQHWLLLQAEIQEIDSNILDTDHKAATCTIEAWNLTQGVQAPRIKQPNNRFDWNQTSHEQWTAFDTQILQQLKIQYPTDTTSNSVPINNKWNVIRDIILKAAAQHIKKFKEKRRRSKPTHPQASHILILAKLIRISKLCIRDKTTNNHLNTINNLHLQLSHKFDTPPSPPTMTNIHSTNAYLLQQWNSELSTHLTVVKLSWKKLLQEKQKAQINRYIHRRQQMLADNKKDMIRSILDKPSRHITLDKLIIHNPDPQVIHDPHTIKDIVKDHFQQWTQRRTPLPISNVPFWTEEYLPKQQIQIHWYDSLTSPITIPELRQIIITRSN
jgi:hypothetical protein